MGKISPVSIKYIIHARFIATGTVEKPDVIGAIFGQTEGLLGEDLELRDLQKGGKIGRIEVETETKDGKTLGKIEIPTALDKTETTLIAATLETIDRIGPSDAKIQVDEIEDVRENKREYIIERAKALLENIKSLQPETKEMAESVNVSSRVSRLQEYGKEMLPAGDLSGDDMIVVEGRADVLNLLRHGIYNVIGMNGTILPETIKELSNNKTLTLFVDGDRGGILIAKNIIENAKIDFIVFAPAGKEVEELSGKEIIAALRKKVTTEEFKQSAESGKTRRLQKAGVISKITAKRKKFGEEPKLPSEEEKEIFRSKLYDLIGTRGVYILDSKFEILGKVPIGELAFTLSRLGEEVYAVILDGTATPEIIRAAERTACKHIVARNFTAFTTKINLISV